MERNNVVKKCVGVKKCCETVVNTCCKQILASCGSISSNVPPGPLWEIIWSIRDQFWNDFGLTFRSLWPYFGYGSLIVGYGSLICGYGAAPSPARADPGRAGPSPAEPSRAEPGRAEPSRAEPNRADSS